jgi:hypothetical protein
MPEKSGLPSSVLGVGPSRFGLPSGVLGAGVGYAGHCAIANVGTAVMKETNKNALNSVFILLIPLARQIT